MTYTPEQIREFEGKVCTVVLDDSYGKREVEGSFKFHGEKCMVMKKGLLRSAVFFYVPSVTHIEAVEDEK